MLHELIFALHGFPGAICNQISADELATNVRLKLISNRLPFVSASEVSLVSQLLYIGENYLRLQRFIDQFCVTSSGSLYLTALAYGIDDDLEKYRDVLRSTERDLLSDPNLGITHIFSRIKPFCSRLSSLVFLLEHCMQHQERKTTLLEAVRYHAKRSSNFLIEQFLMRVLCHQLSSWLLEGTLHDPYDEFFIKHDLTLSPERFPTFFSPELINDILYTGKAVRANRAKLYEQLETRFGKAFADLDGIECKRTEERLERIVIAVAEFVCREVSRSLFEDYALVEHLTLMRDVLLLGRGELFVAFLDNLESAESCGRVTGRSLLDRPIPSNVGETRAIARAVNAAFSSAARSVGFGDQRLSQTFQFTVSMNPREDLSKTEDRDDAHLSVFDCLSVAIFPNGPPLGLDTVFTEGACDSYRRLFMFLLMARRTQHVINASWASDSEQRRKKIKASHFEDNALLRHQMAFIVDNLNCYLQVDVIESTFKRLLDAFKTSQQNHHHRERIEEAEDVEIVEKEEYRLGFVESLHEAYLAGLESQSLMLHPTLSSIVHRILATCRSHSLHPEETTQQAQFEHLSSTLFSALVAAQSTRSHVVGVGVLERTGRVGGGHLSQFLLRLDYNRFFSSKINV